MTEPSKATGREDRTEMGKAGPMSELLNLAIAAHGRNGALAGSQQS